MCEQASYPPTACRPRRTRRQKKHVALDVSRRVQHINLGAGVCIVPVHEDSLLSVFHVDVWMDHLHVLRSIYPRQSCSDLGALGTHRESIIMGRVCQYVPATFTILLPDNVAQQYRAAAYGSVVYSLFRRGE